MVAVITPELSHVRLIRSGGPRAHPIDARCSAFLPIQRTTIGHVTCILKKGVGFSPTREKLRELIGFKSSDGFRGWIPFRYTEGWTLCTIDYIKYMYKYSHMSPCRVCAAWAHVALPRGPECHVASTWPRAEIKPLFTLFNSFLSFKNWNKFRKIQKKSPKNRKFITFNI